MNVIIKEFISGIHIKIASHCFLKDFKKNAPNLSTKPLSLENSSYVIKQQAISQDQIWTGYSGKHPVSKSIISFKIFGHLKIKVKISTSIISLFVLKLRRCFLSALNQLQFLCFFFSTTDVLKCLKTFWSCFIEGIKRSLLASRHVSVHEYLLIYMGQWCHYYAKADTRGSSEDVCLHVYRN